jgi:porin
LQEVYYRGLAAAAERSSLTAQTPPPEAELSPSAPSANAQVAPDAEAAAQEAAAAAALGEALSLLHHTPYPFGAPSTVVGDFGESTQLFGDWGGVRSEWARNGVFLDIFSTTVLQGVVSGGNSGGATVTQNLDAYLTLSSDLLGWWQGGLLHLTVQSKFGDPLSQAGAFSPLNYGAAFPVAQPGDYILPTEYYLLQALSPQVSLLVGKANLTNFGDTNVFANSYRYQFQNASLNNNLMLGAYAPPSTWGGAVIWTPVPWLSIVTGAVDPSGAADNFADDFFEDVAVLQEFDFTYELGERPGNFRIGWIWSSKGGTNFSDPLNITGDGRIDFRDPIRQTDSGYMFYANFDQYLYLVDEAQLDPDLEFATPRGLGLFGRVGFGPERSNLINTFGSLGIGAKGIIPGRPYDEFGLGWYYLNFSDGTTELLRNVENALGISGFDFDNESGIEAYYNFAITPAMQLAVSGQYIFNPFLSDAGNAFTLGGRLQINF